MSTLKLSLPTETRDLTQDVETSCYQRCNVVFEFILNHGKNVRFHRKEEFDLLWLQFFGILTSNVKLLSSFQLQLLHKSEDSKSVNHKKTYAESVSTSDALADSNQLDDIKSQASYMQIQFQIYNILELIIYLLKILLVEIHSFQHKIRIVKEMKKPSGSQKVSITSASPLTNQHQLKRSKIKIPYDESIHRSESAAAPDGLFEFVTELFGFHSAVSSSVNTKESNSSNSNKASLNSSDLSNKLGAFSTDAISSINSETEPLISIQTDNFDKSSNISNNASRSIIGQSYETICDGSAPSPGRSPNPPSSISILGNTESIDVEALETSIREGEELLNLSWDKMISIQEDISTYIRAFDGKFMDDLNTFICKR